MADFDDDDVPAGVDPLIANPIIATGETGAIERPGDDRPAWVIGVFFAAFCALISGLVTVALTRNDPVDEVAPTVATGAPEVAATAAEASAGDTAAASPPESASAASVPAVDPVGVDDVRLPDLGMVRVDGRDFTIAAGCAVHLPLAPNDADAQVSSYFFRTENGEPWVVDRRFDERDDIGASVLGGDYTFVSVEDVGDSGAFVARFADANGTDLEVGVNPSPDGGLDCGDSLVTNEQGQLAFPYTRIVMDVCTTGTQGADLFAAGITSEGGRFSAQANGDDTVTLTYRNADLGADLVDSAASSFESGDRLGYSGIVTNGSETLDITVDFTVGDAPSCTVADEL